MSISLKLETTKTILIATLLLMTFCPIVTARSGKSNSDRTRIIPFSEVAELTNISTSTQSKLQMKQLQLTLPAGWTLDYNKILEDWTAEKYVPQADGTNAMVARIYFDQLPEDAPEKLDAYADKLKQKDFQDYSYIYTKITEKGKLADGFAIKGLVVDYSAKKSQPELSFVMMRSIQGVKLRCRSGTLVSDAVRTEAMNLCSTARFSSTNSE